MGGGFGSLLRPTSSGWSRPFGGGGGNQQGNGGVADGRPRSSSGLTVASASSGLSLKRSGTIRSTHASNSEERESAERKRAGGLGATGGLRDKFHALANRLKEREHTVVPVEGAEEGEEGDGLTRKTSRARS